MTTSSQHPPFRGPRVKVALLADATAGRVAGRVTLGPDGQRCVADDTGALRLAGEGLPEVGAVIAVEGRRQGDALAVAHVEVLVRPTRPGLPVAPRVVEALCARDRMNRAVRAFFHDRGFFEAETPNLVPAPGTDPHLDAFETRFAGMGPIPPAPLYLHTSPEFWMKRLLASGAERIFQLCKVYRDGEWTATHNPEFTMVEWYRAYADYLPIIDDVEALVRAVLGERETLRWGEREVSMAEPFERLTVAEAFERWCGLDILALDTPEALRAEAEARGLGPLSPGGAWDDLFHELMLTWIEPHLGAERPTFLTQWPRPLAVLSRACDHDPRVAERFELYILGLELCNGFTELNDPVEQRARFQEDLDHRRALGKPAYPMPEGFLQALEQGMPPSGGVAVGLDRLLMLALDAPDLTELLLRAVPPVAHD